MAYADAASKSNFAWALHAGLAYEVTNSFTVEFAYRYVNLGTAITGDIICLRRHEHRPTIRCTFKDITSHDFRFGVRWMLQPEPVYQPPLMRRG